MTIYLSQFAVGCLAVLAAYLVALIIFLYVRGNIFRAKALNYIRETNEYADELEECRKQLRLAQMVTIHDFGQRRNVDSIEMGIGTQEHHWLDNQDLEQNEKVAFQSFIDTQHNNQIDDGYEQVAREVLERIVV
jgi:hypothetical protein